MNLKSILAGAAMAASAIAVSPAIAENSLKSLTPADKVTIKKTQEFSACVKKAQPAIVEKVTKKIQSIVTARQEATRKSLEAAGLIPSAADQLSSMMSQGEVAALFNMIGASIAQQESQPFLVKCGKDGGIGNEEGFTEEYKKSHTSLLERFGPKIFEIPPAPKAEIKPA